MQAFCPPFSARPLGCYYRSLIVESADHANSATGWHATRLLPTQRDYIVFNPLSARSVTAIIITLSASPLPSSSFLQTRAFASCFDVTPTTHSFRRPHTCLNSTHTRFTTTTATTTHCLFRSHASYDLANSRLLLLHPI
jgi:hypothetical protein